MHGKELNKNLQQLLNHLDSIKDTFPMVMLLLSPYQKKADKKFTDFIDEKVDEIEDEDGEKAFAVKFEDSKIFDQLSKNAQISNLALKIIPESLFVSLISQFDSYLNGLFRLLYEIRPEFINDSERELTFAQLTEFDSIENARAYIIEKEVETVLRKSHSDHFSYLENKLAMPLRKDLPIWKTFIEITERRNLFVHCDGIVSSQYLKVCKENKCETKVKLNTKVYVDAKYFINAYECLYELGAKLTHTIWRKLVKDEIKLADQKLNEICFDLINNGQYVLADVMLDFACKQTRFYNDASRNLFIVNKSLSLGLQDKFDESKKIINEKDWSASSDDFRLAHLVLTEDYEAVYALMQKIGPNGDIHKENYRNWPLFFKLREEQKFKTTFEEIFKDEFKVLEIPKRPVQELVDELYKSKPELKDKTVKKVSAVNMGRKKKLMSPKKDDEKEK